MDLNRATALATKLTEENADKDPAERGRHHVEPVNADGSPDRGYRVMRRDSDDFAKYTEVAR